jgi:hypothetical protein
LILDREIEIDPDPLGPPVLMRIDPDGGIEHQIADEHAADALDCIGTERTVLHQRPLRRKPAGRKHFIGANA